MTGCFIIGPVGRPEIPEFRNAPGHLARRALQLHNALWLKHVGETLTPLQYAVLTALELEPGIDQRTLGQRVALDKSTIADMVARLSRRGLIARSSDAADARRKLLRLTDDGRALLYEVAPAVFTIGSEMLSPLSPPEREEFLRLLRCLVFRP
jgi:DNA-binding MarR family transcriptional regulator